MDSFEKKLFGGMGVVILGLIALCVWGFISVDNSMDEMRTRCISQHGQIVESISTDGRTTITCLLPGITTIMSNEQLR